MHGMENVKNVRLISSELLHHLIFFFPESRVDLSYIYYAKLYLAQLGISY